MITQKQIDTRDEYIKSLEYAVIEFSDGTAFRNYKNERKSIADADKEAADAEIIAMVFEDKPEDLRDAQKPIIYNCKNNLYCGASADDPYICCYSCSQKNGCPYTCKKGISYEDCERNDAEIFTMRDVKYKIKVEDLKCCGNCTRAENSNGIIACVSPTGGQIPMDCHDVCNLWSWDYLKAGDRV